jgi:hypothetical protein
MDLLGYIRQKGRDSADTHQKGALQDERRHAQTVLLGWLPAPIVLHWWY